MALKSLLCYVKTKVINYVLHFSNLVDGFQNIQITHKMNSQENITF